MLTGLRSFRKINNYINGIELSEKLNHFYCVNILNIYINSVIMDYFDEFDDLMMTMEERKDLGRGYSYKSRVRSVCATIKL